jgi:hypothetical protein
LNIAFWLPYSSRHQQCLLAPQRVIKPVVYRRLGTHLLSKRGHGIPDSRRDPCAIGRCAIRNVEHGKSGRPLTAPYRPPARDIAVSECGLRHNIRPVIVAARGARSVTMPANPGSRKAGRFEEMPPIRHGDGGTGVTRGLGLWMSAQSLPILRLRARES